MGREMNRESVFPCVGTRTIMTTLTNYGYRLYTLNLLKSLAPFGLDKKVVVACIDARCAALFEQKGYHVVCLDGNLSTFCAWNTKGYDSICYLKLTWIHRLLSLSYNVLMIDGDIVFHQNPLRDLLVWENSEVEGWIQNDSDRDENHTNLCTGYLFLRSQPNMIALYDCVSPAGCKKYETCAFDNNDQTYFNRFVKPYCNVRALPLKEYPNGKVFYENAEREGTVLVHFNWVHGHVKMAKMKEHKMWLLTEDEEC